MAGLHGLDIEPVPLSEVIGHNRRVGRAFFRLVRQFVIAEEAEGSHTHDQRQHG